MPATKFDVEDPFQYLNSLNSYHESEAVAGTLPKAQSLPQRHSHGLYPERISGTAFTAKRSVNKQTFLYRILPSTAQSSWTHLNSHALNHDLRTELQFLPDQFVWPPFKVNQSCTFLDGLSLIGGAGDPTMKNGVAYYSYTCGVDMSQETACYDADGDMLIVPQLGVLEIQTEMGSILVRMGEICVIPRGIHFRVSLPHGPSRGHVIEAFSGHFDVPELGAIGTLGLANVRDFEIPKASYYDTEEVTDILAKFGGKVHTARMKGSAFNAVAWHGTYYPFKYDLGKFMPVGSILYDHQDPSVFTVLTCPSDKPDCPTVDFLLLGPRWLVMEDTFQLPYFHRNTMSEFSSVLSGGFDLARVPETMYGMSALHNNLSPHGIEAREVEVAMTKPLVPERISDDTKAFMIESCYPIGITQWAAKCAIPSNSGEHFGNFRRLFPSKI